jgi:hypothetical protein
MAHVFYLELLYWLNHVFRGKSRSRLIDDKDSSPLLRLKANYSSTDESKI